MLVIQELCKTYNNGIEALKNISLEIPHGIFGLLGPNGAGKSTLMRTLATLQDPDSGTVTLDGTDLRRDLQQSRQNLGYLPQDFGVYPQVSAVELLDQLAVFKGFVNRKQRRAVVEEQLQLVNLFDHRHQQLGTFSGGMRQRFGIAQALLGAPRLIIVDEPTAGLDPAERIRFQNLLAEISQDRVLLLSTHIVEDVAELCPQMAILKQGAIVQSGSPLEMLDNLKGRVWMCPGEDLSEIEEQWALITTRMERGGRCTRVLSETQPSSKFQLVDPDLNDVYFTALM
ncbi:ABC transporter ATP-binding protein [Acaryochloris sp. IP29b_bin.137]|uniref:ABC transporter ATP-binding protein n=1 Tax=Acaryochloris sp. IP29b_bin.137 TaxID=2969217 RepID=UPI002632D804|nr:ABC transporter ATP-binding protein [Acaryochloris sp. IP29b_bin.137]